MSSAALRRVEADRPSWRLSDAELLGKLLLAAQRVAREAKITDSGWRVVVNNGAHAGQSVFHVHLHVLGGRSMAWPPG